MQGVSDLVEAGFFWHGQSPSFFVDCPSFEKEADLVARLHKIVVFGLQKSVLFYYRGP